MQDDAPAPDSSPLKSPDSLPNKPLNNRKPIALLSATVLILVVLAGLAWWLLGNKASAPQTNPSVSNLNQQTTQAEGLQLDPNKNYGNKYADGLLPVGDGKYVTDGAKAGYVYACSGYADNLKREQGGAGKRGPWFVNNNTEYNINTKLHVLGSVSWQSSFSNKISGDKRNIVTNDLPNHSTGVFPIAPSDPAYAFDKNPNGIKTQNLSYELNDMPTYGSPSCIGGEVGVMLTGVALFNGLDAAGRDAGAWEVQDSCSGHPQSSGEYHYHTLSSCIKDISVNTVIGFALDGFPITGPKVGENNILSTDDLDECHGLVSQLKVDGKSVKTYHYVLTQDFPYSVSCFRGQAINPPGMQAATPPRR